MQNRLVDLACIAVLLSFTVLILILGRSLLLPFVVAVVIWYFTVLITDFYGTLLQKVHIPQGFALAFAVVTMSTALYFLMIILSHSINNVIYDAPLYQSKIMEGLAWLNEITKQKLETSKLMANVNFTSIVSNIAYNLTSLAGNLVLILIYVLFLFVEYKTFDGKIRAICKTEKKYKDISEVIAQVRRDVNTYIKIKSAMSLLTGVSSYIILLSFNVLYAEFWGILIFLLNYIPTIGSILAVGITLLAVAVQFNTIWSLLLLGFLLIAVQFIVGNIIETRYLGKHLNLSPLVILLSLAVWSGIWGVIGMFLCVPLMTIMAIIMAKFPASRPIAILLSGRAQFTDFT